MKKDFMLKGIALMTSILISLFISSSIYAANINQIKAAMKARIPELTRLKLKGVVGEDNRGFLSFRGPSREGADIVDAENRDRQVVYRAIAAKTGATPQDVGMRRAKKIAQIEPHGVWIQGPGGNWYRK